MIATLERTTTPASSRGGFSADLSGRFLHDDAWVHAVLVGAGFQLVVIEPMSIRQESERAVPGSVVVARLAGPRSLRLGPRA